MLLTYSGREYKLAYICGQPLRIWRLSEYTTDELPGRPMLLSRKRLVNWKITKDWHSQYASQEPLLWKECLHLTQPFSSGCNLTLHRVQVPQPTDVGSINYFEYNFMTNCPKCPISKNPLRHQITCLGRKGSFGLAHLGVQVDSFSPTGTSQTLQIMADCCKCMQHALLSISAQKLAPAIFLRQGTLIERHASMCTHALVLACYFGRPSHANCIWPAHRHRLWNPRNTKILPTTYYRIG